MAASDPAAGRPRRRSPTVASLLDLDPDLGHGLAPDAWEAARRAARVRLTSLPRGRWRPRATQELLLVSSGLLVRELRLGGRTSSELVGPGDLLETATPTDDVVPIAVEWHVVEPAKIAVLSASGVRGLPAIVGLNLVRRAAQRATRLSAAQSIAQLARVEDRILALFGQLANRWGRVTPAGIVVTLELTHETVGTLVGAARPTVSAALKDLAAAGELERMAAGWRIAPAAFGRLRPGASGALPRVGVLPRRGTGRTRPARHPGDIC